VYVAARRTCTVYRLDGDQLVDLGTAMSIDDGNAGIASLDDGSLVGVTGTGTVWRRDPDGSFRTYDLVDLGFSVGEPAQSMLRDPRGRIWVGGSFRMNVHDIPAGAASDDDTGDAPAARQFRLGGEPKTLVHATDSGLIYAPLYPSTAVVAISPDDFSVTELGRIGNGQYRPSGMVHDPDAGQLVISTGGTPGTNQGAVTFVDLASRDFEVRKDVLVGMKASSLWRDGRTLYVAGDTRGEQNPPPDREWAEIAAVDLDTRRVLWRKEMVGHKRLGEICVHQGLLYVLPIAIPSRWFGLDVRTREIVLDGTVSSYGDVKPYRGAVYSYTHFSDDIARLPGRDGGAEQVLYPKLPRQAWFNNPVLTFDQVRGGTWGIYEKDLAFFPLP
ncbi:MAG: YncE family protein, partial [Micromonosporaceae bacterium]